MSLSKKGTIGFNEAWDYIKEQNPGMKVSVSKQKAKVLYHNLFRAAFNKQLSLDFTCTRCKDGIHACNCERGSVAGKWFHSVNPKDVADYWRIGVRSLINLKETEIDHFQIQTADHIKGFVAYIKRMTR